jgi:galactokinase
MTGAGFGGCAIALVKENAVNEFQQKLMLHYEKIIGYAPDVFTTTAEDGVREISF